MQTLLGVTSIMSLIFAASAVESDFYWFAFGFTVLGIATGFFTLYLQSEEEQKEKQLYYKED